MEDIKRLTKLLEMKIKMYEIKSSLGRRHEILTATKQKISEYKTYQQKLSKIKHRYERKIKNEASCLIYM